MVAADRPKFRELVMAMAVNYRAEVSTAQWVLLWEGLQDLPYADLRAACSRAVREDEHMPTIARLRALAGHGRDVKPYHLPAEPERHQLPAERGWLALGPMGIGDVFAKWTTDNKPKEK